MKKYKLQNVMTSIHVQMLWYRMQRALEPEIWYEMHADEVLAAATLGGGEIGFWRNGLTKDRSLTVMQQIVWQ